VVRGGPNDVGTWPAVFDSQPPNRRILRQGASGSGKVLEDRTSEIQLAVTNYNKTKPAPPSRDGGCSISGGRDGERGSAWLLAIGLALTALFRRARARS
jgi:hypothetical protein